MINSDEIDLSPMPRIAQEVYNLAKKVDESSNCDISLKGIGIDGYFVAKGFAYVIEKEYGIIACIEPVEINSHEGKILFDEKRMNEFKDEVSDSNVVWLIDKRSKTGTLGNWLEQKYPEFDYVVLVDLTGKTISATNEDIAWIQWGDDLKEAYKNAFDVLGLKINKVGNNQYSYIVQEPKQPLFMEQFYYELDKVMAQGKRKPVDEIDEESFE